jgi:hypothetical protein
MPIVPPLHVQKDRRRPNTVIIRDANGRDVGLIHRRSGLWSNFPSDEANAKKPVQLGPFPSLEAAFQAYCDALEDWN